MSDEVHTYSYEKALEETLKYFEGNELSAKVFLDKYALRNEKNELIEKTPDDMHHRLAKEFARIEKKKFKTHAFTEDEIYKLFKDFKNIIPQGSPLTSVGNPYQYVSTGNCFVVQSPEDSYASILKSDEQLVQICKRRGGVGIDVSNLRPNKTPTKNSSKFSTGIIPFMERYSNSIREVGQENRRGALMITLSIHHPESVILEEDVLDFASIKNDPLRITGANISLKLTNEFLEAVEKGTTYEQRFPIDYKEKGIKPLISKQVDAKKAWGKIIRSAWLRAEPGLLFWDNILKESPANCYSKFGFGDISTNPCSEIPLCEFDSCRLLLINLFGSVKNPFTSDAYFDFDEFRKNAYIAQRLMDDLIDIELECIDRIVKKIEKDPESIDIKDRELTLWKSIKIKCESGRRTGTGITALGDTIASLGLKYGSNECLEFVEKVYLILKLGAYTASIDIAEEIAPFPIWDHRLEIDNPFFLRLKEEDPELYKRMSKVGRRNIALLTTAPAGSVSILACIEVEGKKYFNTTSGIEPNYSNVPYIRKRKITVDSEDKKIDEIDDNGDKWEHYKVYPSGVEAWMNINKSDDIKKSPYYKSSAEEVDWSKRVQLQAIATKHIDHSISSTINLPNDVSEKEVAKIYETAWKLGCKGITVYRDGCRNGVLVKEITLDPNKIQKTVAPKRPKDLGCDIHHITYNGNRYYVAVGLFEGEPYEVFAGLNEDGEGDPIVPKSIKIGKITKKERGKYTLICEEKDWSNSLNNGKSGITDEIETITRLLSTSLRHGADISFIVHQLEKTKGDLQSFSKVLARTLKKYIPDGTKVSGESCPNCKEGKLKRQEGCISCSTCGYSKC